MAFTSLPLLARACAVVCVAIGALHAPVAQAVATSDIFVNPANGHQYLLLDHATWTASEGMAITQGGHLVTINNGAENDWVYNTFEPMLPRDGGSNSLWIHRPSALASPVFDRKVLAIATCQALGTTPRFD